MVGWEFPDSQREAAGKSHPSSSHGDNPRVQAGKTLLGKGFWIKGRGAAEKAGGKKIHGKKKSMEKKSMEKKILSQRPSSVGSVIPIWRRNKDGNVGKIQLG